MDTSYDAVRAGRDSSVVRAWALARGIEVSTTGGLPRFVYELYDAEHPDGAPT